MRLLAAALAALALYPSCAAAAPGLLLGVDDDSLKWYGHTGSLVSIYRTLELGAVRVTLTYPPDRTERTELQRIAQAARSLRVIVAVTGSPSAPPLDQPSRDAFCAYVASILRRIPSVHDVAIWTEPNSSTFWQPQKGAPAAYEALLATCWDDAHAVQPAANVIATSAPHARPGDWYRALGRAYKASARALPIFDTVGHNAYPETSAESPDAHHAKRSIDEGDLDRLLHALRVGFAGTAQPLPGTGGVTVWYLEDGFQTIPARALYTGTETDRHPISEADQAAQLTAAIRLAYCQPAVGAFFNFELRDDSSLDGWQSGLLRPDWSAKPAFAAFQQATADVRDAAIECPAG
jgi:hypothetical protein